MRHLEPDPYRNVPQNTRPIKPACASSTTTRQRHTVLRHLLVVLIVLFAAELASASGDTFTAMIKTQAADVDECLVFKGDGQGEFIERYAWGPGPYCGYPGGRDAMLAGRQALFTFEPLGNDEYLIWNSSRGKDECLIFSNNGHAELPSRYTWGSGPYCGLAGGLHEVRANGQAVWKLHHLEGDRYAITNSSRDGHEECLIFGNNGHNQHPSRYNWGGGSYCGFPGGLGPLLDNRQAVFEIEKIRTDTFVVPDSWLDGVLIFENRRYTHQRLHVGHDGNGVIYVSWGSDPAYRWDVELAGDGNYFFLTNSMHTHQRLHVGHDGNGVLYGSWGTDDAYRWTVEPLGGGGYYLRNKKYPHQRVRVGSAGDATVGASFGTDKTFQWDIHVLPSVDAPAPSTFWLSTDYRNGLYALENHRYSSQKVHIGHNGDGIIYTGNNDDFAYHWRIEPAGNPSYVFLTNYAYSPGQRLRADPGGGPGVTTGFGNDDSYRWRVEPVSQSFSLTNKLTGRRLQVDRNGSGHIGTGHGTDGESRWWFRLKEDLPPWPGMQDSSCHTPGVNEVVYKVCFFQGENHTGERWCRTLAGHAPFRVNLPEGVARNVYSVRTWNCEPSRTRAPKIFVYDEADQHSDTEVIDGMGNLGGVGGKARSFQMLHERDEWDYVCLHKGDNGTGPKHCVTDPGNGHWPVRNLSPDFNDQVRSISKPSWWLGCRSIELWEHGNSEGQRIEVAADENLSNRPILVNGQFKKWSDVVSSYRYLRPFPCAW